MIDDHDHVYGVLGVSILEEYLTTLLPNVEINSSGFASYELGVTTSIENEFDPILDSTLFDCTQNLTLKEKNDCYYVDNSRDEVYAAVEALHLYNTNTPYLDEQWSIMALIKNDDLMAFSCLLYTSNGGYDDDFLCWGGRNFRRVFGRYDQ